MAVDIADDILKYVLSQKSDLTWNRAVLHCCSSTKIYRNGESVPFAVFNHLGYKRSQIKSFYLHLKAKYVQIMSR